MYQQLPTHFTAIQTERENREITLSRDWTAASALPEHATSTSLKRVVGAVTTTLVGMVSAFAALIR